MTTQRYCSAPWCDNVTAKAAGQSQRTVDGRQVCRNCYQYIWERAKELGVSHHEVGFEVVPPVRNLPRIRIVCEREGCRRILAEGESRRSIVGKHLCRTCYQATWELGKELGLSIQQAWGQLPAKR